MLLLSKELFIQPSRHSVSCLEILVVWRCDQLQKMGGHKGHLISVSPNSFVDNKHAILYTYRMARSGCSFYMKPCEQPILSSKSEQTFRGANISIKGARLHSCLQERLVHCKPVWFRHVSCPGMAVVVDVSGLTAGQCIQYL